MQFSSQNNENLNSKPTRKGNKVFFDSEKYDFFGSHLHVLDDGVIDLNSLGEVAFFEKDPDLDNIPGYITFVGIDHLFEKEIVSQAYDDTVQRYLATVAPIAEFGKTLYRRRHSVRHMPFSCSLLGNGITHRGMNGRIERRTETTGHSKEYILERLDSLREKDFISDTKHSELLKKANHEDDTEAQQEIMKLQKDYMHYLDDRLETLNSHS